MSSITGGHRFLVSSCSSLASVLAFGFEPVRRGARLRRAVAGDVERLPGGGMRRFGAHAAASAVVRLSGQTLGGGGERFHRLGAAIAWP